MPRLNYEIEDHAAFSEMVTGRATSAALKKFFQNHCEYYTEQSRNCLNSMPQNFDAKIKNDAQAKQYAAMAKAYGTMWAELEMAAKQ
jgi:hypothetical protein